MEGVTFLIQSYFIFLYEQQFLKDLELRGERQYKF